MPISVCTNYIGNIPGLNKPAKTIVDIKKNLSTFAYVLEDNLNTTDQRDTLQSIDVYQWNYLSFVIGPQSVGCNIKSSIYMSKKNILNKNAAYGH